MTTHNYVMVLFEKDREGTPKLIGQKRIEKQQYIELTDDIFKSFMVGDVLWYINERRYFYREDSIAVSYYVMIDGEMQTKTTDLIRAMGINPK